MAGHFELISAQGLPQEVLEVSAFEYDDESRAFQGLRLDPQEMDVDLTLIFQRPENVSGTDMVLDQYRLSDSHRGNVDAEIHAATTADPAAWGTIPLTFNSAVSLDWNGTDAKVVRRSSSTITAVAAAAVLEYSIVRFRFKASSSLLVPSWWQYVLRMTP